MRDRPFSQRGTVRVDTLRGGANAVNVGVDDGFPLVFQVLGEVGIHPGGGQRHIAGQDQRRSIIIIDPEFVHDRRHEFEHATGALKPLQGGPVLIEPIQQFGVQRVGGPNAVFIVVGGGHVPRE